MDINEDKETRYFIDLDLSSRIILNWDHGQRVDLVQKLENPLHQRIFISKGQFNKLVTSNQAIRRLKKSKLTKCSV